MQLFTRRVHLVGPPRETMTYAADMCAYVAEKSGRDIALWSAMFGAPIGTMFFTVRVDGLADLQAATASFIDDDEYHDKLAAGREFMGAPAEDSISTPLYGELGDPPPVGAYAQITAATIANGKYADAFAWGAEIAGYTAGLTGLPAMFLAGQFGAFGNVTWISGAPDLAAVDSSMVTVNTDAGYMERLGAAKELFQEGSGQQGLLTRVA